MLWRLAVLAALACAQGRVVNISNTWVLPEEGFPVFYRHFRDRISWYEADAVCQFHHANLVTVDTTAQYDAVRAYLKELDVGSAVWVGLIRSNPDGDFTWTDYRGLSSEGYWSAAPDARAAPLCAAADPAADYRWEARACGGPMVASFICELPVPQWASGPSGCMVRALPALTVLYLPESAAVQLTADCGLAGVKRVQCTGNVKREDLLGDLSCPEEPEESTTLLISETTAESITSELNTEQDPTHDVTMNENITTDHVTETTPEPNVVRITPIPYQLRPIIHEDPPYVRVPLNTNVNIHIINDNNLESNDIPKFANEHVLSEEEANKLEDEKYMAHKQLHNDLAHIGNIPNFETIFSQPADHFIPPLVMAKARMGNDMTVLSLEEKHAQQHLEQYKHKGYGELHYVPDYHVKQETLSTTSETTTTTTEMPTITTMLPLKNKEVFGKDMKSTKYGSKKYNEKYSGPKVKNIKSLEKPSKYTDKPSLIQTELTTVHVETTTKDIIKNNNNQSGGDAGIDLSVIIKDTVSTETNRNLINPSTEPTNKITYTDNKTKKDLPESITSEQTQTSTETHLTSIPEMTHEIVKITILDENSLNTSVFEVTTKVPISENVSSTTIKPVEYSVSTKEPLITSPTMSVSTTVGDLSTTTNIKINISEQTTPNDVHTSVSPEETTENLTTSVFVTSTQSSSTENIGTTTVTTNKQLNENPITANEQAVASTENTDTDTTQSNKNESISSQPEEPHIMEDFHGEDLMHSDEVIDDLNSPLLSAANEPLHRPNRSRRPQQPLNRIKKFNPFRILG
ncbi:hypothetical protein JYU34_002337 [Plutella xylostella]|uniref:C-type lectin domain-containing protein n=1 Tax=Plutella xylostella TaxID=51655 RepID=A0ABQ7R1Z5_PLUXY|nr:hypothetical protein JYU34_002337 [Plutella xylostella]